MENLVKNEPLKIKGYVISISDIITVGNINKRTFLIDVTDNEKYPTIIEFTLLGDKTEIIMGAKIGTLIEVSFGIKSKEYNGKYFSNINAYSITILNKEIGKTTLDTKTPPSKYQKTSAPIPDLNGDDMPF